MTQTTSSSQDLQRLFEELRVQHGWDGFMNITKEYVTFRTSNLNHFNEFKGMCFLLNLEEFPLAYVEPNKWGVGYNYG